MPKKSSGAKPGSDLRARAEELAAAAGPDLRKMALEDVHKLVHELQVHQIELERQNEELRQAQMTIAEARARYVDLHDSAPVGYFILSRHGRIAEVNLTGAGFLGVEKSLLVNQPFYRWVAPEYRETSHAHFQKVFETGARQSCELKLKSRDGLAVHVALESIAAPGEGKTSRHCRTTMSDLTARKRGEAREADLWLTGTLLDAASDSIFLHDLEGNFIYFNEAAYKNRGYEREELQRKGVLALVSPDYAGTREKLLQELQAQGAVIFESAHLCKDGSVMPVEIHARIIELDNRRLILSVARDITKRRRAEAALQESEEKYRTIVETAQEGIWIIDPAGKVSYTNRRLAEMLGYPVQEMLGRHLFDFMDDAGRKVAQERLEHCWQGIRETYDFQLRRQDGSAIWTMVAAAPFLDSQGNVIGALGMITDISGRKQAEEALQKERDQAQKYLDIAAVAFVALDPAGHISLINKKGCEILGYAEQELVGQNWFALCLPPEIADEIKGVFNRLLAGDIEPVQCYENPVLTKTGEQRILAFHNTVIRDASSRIIGVLCSGEDISERRQAREALRAAAHEWRITFDAIGDAVCLLDRDGRIILCNRAMVDLVRKPFPEIVGRTCWEVMHDATVPTEECLITGMWQSRRRETMTLPRGDRWLHLIVDPILNGSGEVTGAVHIISDITARKRSQDKVRDLNILLQAIKEINETLLRVKSEPELFQRTCDLLIKVPYVRFNWIGLVASGSFEVKPAAWAGVEAGYLSIIKVTWDDSACGRGPTGEAIRSGKPVVRKCIDTDPQPNPWREEALKRGYKSSIALPLIWESEVIGVLNVYAGKTAAFGVEEIEFLGQVAGDIAVGLKSLRLERGLEHSVRQLQASMRQTVEAIAAIAETRDPYTGGHQRRVTQLACALAATMGFDDDRIEGCRVIGFLHDIGKIMVPAEILNKPGKLGEFEVNIIRGHAQVGYDILKNIDFPWPVAQTVLQHHERLDGSGYPASLKGEEILLEARILAVADVVEAISSHRPYRPSYGIDAALRKIVENRGTLYDPAVVDACVKLFKERNFEFE